MAEYLNLLLEIDEDSAVASLTINRADKLNALNHALLDELSDALDAVVADTRVRALVVTGAGTRAFVAGADISEIAAIEDAKAGTEFSLRGQEVFSRLERLACPVIIAINGYALGAGLELALCGDIRLAADTAQLGQPEINLGVFPGYGGTQRLARVIGRDRAKYLIFTGERVSAEEAYRLGLVERVVAAEQLIETAVALARSLASRAPAALALAKAAVNEGAELPLDEALRHEAELFGAACATEDRREGATAFLEKRQPRWSGR